MSVNEVVVNGVTELSLVNDTVSETSLLEGETAHDASGEQIIGKARYINPNLLINSDFSINQRGFSNGDLHPYTYSVDGWCAANADAHITVDGDKVTVKNGGDLSYASYGQVIEKLKAGTYTISADFISADSTIDEILVRIVTKDDVTFVGAKVLCTPITGFVPGRYSYTFEVADDIEGVLVYWYSHITGTLNNESFVITKPKLEPGSVATPFVPPNPAVELAKCQRYYIPAPLSCIGLTGDTESLIYLLPTPTPMRIIPSLENVTFRLADVKTNIEIELTGWVCQVLGQVSNGLVIRVVKSNHGLNVKDYYLEITTGGLSAEL